MDKDPKEMTREELQVKYGERYGRALVVETEAGDEEYVNLDEVPFMFNGKAVVVPDAVRPAEYRLEEVPLSGPMRERVELSLRRERMAYAARHRIASGFPYVLASGTKFKLYNAKSLRGIMWLLVKDWWKGLWS